jgi:hypothetical protein
MEPSATALPNDIDALNAMVFARDEMLRECEVQVSSGQPH